MSLSVANRTFKGMSNLSILRKSDGVLFNFPKPMNFVLSTGTQNRDQMTRNDSGEMAFANTFTVSRQPTLNITYSLSNASLLAFRMNQNMEPDVDIPIKIPRTFVVPSTLEVKGAVDPNEWGYGVVADAVDAKGSATIDNNLVELTQQTYANWNTWSGSTTPSFAVGTNGNLRFSTNLANQLVNLSIPNTIDGRVLKDTLVGDCQIETTFVDSTNRVTILQVFNALIRADGSTIDPSAESLEVAFNVTITPESCLGYRLIETDQYVKC